MVTVSFSNGDVAFPYGESALIPMLMVVVTCDGRRSVVGRVMLTLRYGEWWCCDCDGCGHMTLAEVAMMMMKNTSLNSYHLSIQRETDERIHKPSISFPPR